MVPARPRSGPRWRTPGSTNRRRCWDRRLAGRAGCDRGREADHRCRPQPVARTGPRRTVWAVGVAKAGRVLDPGRAVPDVVLRVGGRVAFVPGVPGPVAVATGSAVILPGRPA